MAKRKKKEEALPEFQIPLSLPPKLVAGLMNDTFNPKQFADLVFDHVVKESEDPHAVVLAIYEKMEAWMANMSVEDSVLYDLHKVKTGL